MPKFARPNSYNGRQANLNYTGDLRVATLGETIQGKSAKLAVSPASLQSLSALQLSSPTPIGNTLPNTINSTVLTVQDQIEVKGGLVTDSIGSDVLVAGTVTINNTNISSSDIILLSRSDVNASTALGHLTYTIVDGVSFTIDSLDATATLETGDLSTVSYLIIRQV
jgi:hypothetical protein